MELDTGASFSVMSSKTYNSLWPSDIRPELKPSCASLTTYTGEAIQVLGQISVHISYQTQKHTLPLLVVPADGPTLLGRDWLAKLKLNWNKIYQLCSHSDVLLQQVLDRYSSVFSGSLGEISNAPASLHVDPLQAPKFFKAHQVPYSLKTKVEEELTRLQESGVISPVCYSEWAAPIVPVVKNDGNIRLCGDYKLTVNAVSRTDP